MLGRIRRFQREHGSASGAGKMGICKTSEYRTWQKRLQGAIVLICGRKPGRCDCFRISGNAKENFPGKKKQKLQLWRKRDIQKTLCRQQAHRKGNPNFPDLCLEHEQAGLMMDQGRLPVTRGRSSVCVRFQTGKRYNCDLSASYNIGARYFIREILKPLAGNGKVFAGGKSSCSKA